MAGAFCCRAVCMHCIQTGMWMQALIILIQNTVLVGQIYHLSKTPVWRRTALVALLATGLFLCLSGTHAAVLCDVESRHGLSGTATQAGCLSRQSGARTSSTMSFSQLHASRRSFRTSGCGAFCRSSKKV